MLSIEIKTKEERFLASGRHDMADVMDERRPTFMLIYKKTRITSIIRRILMENGKIYPKNLRKHVNSGCFLLYFMGIN